MADNEELTRILRILATTGELTQSGAPPLSPHSDDDDDAYSPPPAVTPDQRQSYPPPSPPREEVIDPSKIEEWTPAVRYVMREFYRNEAIIAGIKKMINSQHEHEKAWFNARQDIINKHNARRESGKKVEELLRKLGTLPLARQGVVQPTAESETEELAVFDRKVYTRSEQMVAHMAKEFASMNIPFFCHPNSDSPEMLDRKRRMVELLQDMNE